MVAWVPEVAREVAFLAGVVVGMGLGLGHKPVVASLVALQQELGEAWELQVVV